MIPHLNNEEMIKFLFAQGYTHVKEVDGRFIGLSKLLYTTGLFLGLDEFGYEERYCYKDSELAEKAFNAMKSVDDRPLSGYVAHRVK